MNNINKTVEGHNDKNDQEIYYFDFTEGDYNDVYSRKVLKGTFDQADDFCKSYFTGEDFNNSEKTGSFGSVGYELYYTNETDENGNEYEDQELRIQYYAIADCIEEATQENKDEYEDSDLIDLTKENE